MTRPRPYLFGLVASALSAAVLASSIFVDGDDRTLTLLGLPCLLLAPVFFVPPLLLLGKHGAVDEGDAYFATGRVVDRGVYRVVRHRDGA